MKYLRWFINVSRSVRWSLVLSVCCQLCLTFVALGYVYISKALVDIATGDMAPLELFNGGGLSQKQGLILYAGLMIACILTRISLQSICSYVESKADVKIANKLRYKEFSNLLRLQSDFRARFHSGDMVNRLQSDVNAISGATSKSIPNLIGALLQFLAAFIYLMHLEPGLAWILLIIVPLGIFGGRFVMRRIRKLSLAVREGDSRVQSHVQESMQNLSVIKTLEYVPSTSAELEDLQNDVYGKVMKRTRFTIVARILTALAFSIGYAVAFLWGIRGIFLGSVTFGLMTAFLQLVGQIQRPLMIMSDQLPTLFHCTASIDRLEEIEALPKEAEDDPVMVDGIAGIRVVDVDFTYPDGTEKILDKFCHDFTPGSRTAIVGETGVGKSTLIKLLLALQKPDKGSITIYGDKGGEVAASNAGRCNLVYVPQGNSLMSGTVRENLLMGDPEADEERMKEVLHIATADFVLEMENGLDTQCFEAGGGLSEGQAQRIAIARALLRPGTLLLLDEFSSALDPQTENTLLERLTSSRTGKTMIFITHRERIADFCDNILKFE